MPTLVRAAEASTTLPAAAVNTFVPSCARGCYQAFLENNKFLDACGANPSLDCLCTRYGSSGAAFGEGAVQCMAAELNVNRCQADQVQASVTAAYSVCHTIAGFSSPTQKVIVATTVVQTHTFKPTTSSTTSTSSTTTPSTKNSAITSSIPTTLITAPTTTPKTSPETSKTLSNTGAQLPNSSSKPSTAPEQASSPARLSGGQVAGVTVGAVSGVFLLLALLFFLRRRRQDRLQNGENARRSSYQENYDRAAGGGGGGGGGITGPFSKLRDSWGLGGSKKSQTSSRPQSMQISGPVNNAASDPWAPRPYETIVAGALPRGEEQGGAIGVALSPENRGDGRFQTAEPVYASAAIPRRSRSLQYTPPQHGQPRFARQNTGDLNKPALTLAIPPSRDSDVTEFAEDGEEDGGAQIWRPPAGDPQSATAYYVADKWGNWRRKSTIKGPRPEGLGDRDEGAIDPSAAVAPLNVPRKLGSPINLGPQRDELSASSSVYSPFSPPQSVHPDPKNPMPPFPKSAYAKMLAMNNELSGQPGAVAQLPVTPERAAVRSRNSPVSPGVSPVSYPAIPRRDARRSMAPGQRQQLAEAQASPRNAVHNTLFPPRDPVRSPAGQPSPTLGAAVPVRPEQPPAAGRSLTGGGPRARAVVPDYGNPYSNNNVSQPPVADYANPYSDIGNGPYDKEIGAKNPASPDSFNTIGSALLTKRLGAEKAADLGLDSDFTGARSQWKREEQQKVEVPGMGHMRLPSTPGWEPKLTPTRRGEDLFLKVG